MVDSLKAEVKMLLERAEKAEKNILQITNPKEDDVLESSLQNPYAEHSLTYADAIAALKKNILDLDTERLKLMEIVDLRDSSIALLEESVEKYLSLGEGRYLIFGLYTSCFLLAVCIIFFTSILWNFIFKNLRFYSCYFSYSIRLSSYPITSPLFTSLSLSMPSNVRSFCIFRTLRITELEAIKTDLELRLFAAEDDSDRLR